MLHELVFNKRYWNNKAIERFYDKMNFSPKARRQAKRDIKEIFLLAGTDWDKKVLSKNADPDDKEWLVTLSAFAGKMQALIDNIEAGIKFKKVTKRRFSLYLHKSRTKVLFELRFFHPAEGNKNIAGLVIHKKWGKENKIGGMRFGRRVAKKGYEYIDSGRYYRTLVNWFNTGFSFRGRKNRIDFKITYLNRKCIGFYLENPQKFPFFKLS